MNSLGPPSEIFALYAGVDAAIRAGDFAKARRALRRHFESGPPSREAAPWLAELGRRAGLSDAGARLLFRYVYPSETEAARIRATPHELAEYGGCLIRLYAIREAERVLARLPDTDARKFFFLAFARIHEWNYADALALLRKHAAFPSDSPYVSLIARVNLADCLVETGRFDEARTALEKLLADVRRAGANLLEANTLELIAKNYAHAGERKSAARAIAEARSFLGADSENTADAIFLERLERGLALADGRNDSRRKLIEFQARARVHGQYETARDVDLSLAEHDRDVDRFDRLYFGTPFPAYRERITAAAGKLGIVISPAFDWRIGPAGKSGPARAKLFVPGAAFKPGALLDRLFRAVTADLYRPRRRLEIYEGTYPGQVFNPTSSPDQLHQGLKRLRRELLATRLPLELRETNETYSLVARAPITVRLDANADRSTRYVTRLATLEPPFTSRECAKAWACSKNTAIAILKELEGAGEVSREGRGPGTRYRAGISPKSARA